MGTGAIVGLCLVVVNLILKFFGLIVKLICGFFKLIWKGLCMIGKGIKKLFSDWSITR